jgi:hypothetical protein
MAKILCHKVFLNKEGYAHGNRLYFGCGDPLYYVELPDGKTGYVRAMTRDEAIKLAQENPGYWGIR